MTRLTAISAALSTSLIGSHFLDDLTEKIRSGAHRGCNMLTRRTLHAAAFPYITDPIYLYVVPAVGFPQTSDYRKVFKDEVVRNKLFLQDEVFEAPLFWGARAFGWSEPSL